jgi:hypothetical protein
VSVLLTDEARWTIYLCPECGSRYVTKAPHLERLFKENGSHKWCSGPATGARPHSQPVRCVPVEVMPVPTEGREALVERVAEIMWNEREYRDPHGERTGVYLTRAPLLWTELVEGGLFWADQRDFRADAEAVVTALFEEKP